jgi:hypothetical protein
LEVIQGGEEEVKKVLPWLSCIPAFGLVWQMWTYSNNVRREDRKERKAWEKTVDLKLATIDSCVRALKDTVYADKLYAALVDRALATAESQIYRLRHPLPDSGAHP